MAATTEYQMEVNTTQGKKLAVIHHRFRPEFFSGISYDRDKDVVELVDIYSVDGIDLDLMVSWKECDRIQRHLYDHYEEMGQLIPRDMPECSESDFDEEDAA